MTITKGARVVLTPEARLNGWLYGDIGMRVGTVLRIDGRAVVQWAGADVECRVPLEDLEVIP